MVSPASPILTVHPLYIKTVSFGVANPLTVSVIAEIDRLRDILSLSVEAQGTLELPTAGYAAPAVRRRAVADLHWARAIESPIVAT